jgi:hypothetical protein
VDDPRYDEEKLRAMRTTPWLRGPGHPDHKPHTSHLSAADESSAADREERELRKRQSLARVRELDEHDERTRPERLLPFRYKEEERAVAEGRSDDATVAMLRRLNSNLERQERRQTVVAAAERRKAEDEANATVLRKERIRRATGVVRSAVGLLAAQRRASVLAHERQAAALSGTQPGAAERLAAAATREYSKTGLSAADLSASVPRRAASARVVAAGGDVSVVRRGSRVPGEWAAVLAEAEAPSSPRGSIPASSAPPPPPMHQQRTPRHDDTGSVYSTEVDRVDEEAVLREVLGHLRASKK